MLLKNRVRVLLKNRVGDLTVCRFSITSMAAVLNVWSCVCSLVYCVFAYKTGSGREYSMEAQ